MDKNSLWTKNTPLTNSTHSNHTLNIQNARHAGEARCLTPAWLTPLKGVPQRGDWVAFGHELLPNPARVARFLDSTHNRGVVQFLCVVDFIASRVASRMVVGDFVVVRPNRADDVASIISA